MNAFTIYPAIDLRAGRVVRLKEGEPDRMTSYSNNPAQTARRWLDTGAHWLHVINLDGAFDENDRANHTALRSILEVAKRSNAKVQFGGGIRSLQMIENALNLGMSRVVLGTIAIEQPDVIAEALKRFGPEKIAVGIDARDGLVRVRGWKENSRIFATDLARQMRTLGLRIVIYTDVSRDGLGTGLNIPSTRELADVSGLDVIASGGVHTLDDLSAAREANLSGVIIGHALYEGTVDLKDALESNIS
jgi:phosphoribosylformimino-5-aminoimidazole carboxamide ribotide isomerase